MNSGNAPPFDLISEPWLPILLSDGRSTEWGLATLFARAHEARGLSEPSPLTYTAVMRTLLAILHRALDSPQSPKAWANIFQARQFDADRVNDYLTRWRDRFDLYHPQRPFAQVDVSVQLKDNSPVTRLVMEHSSGNNPTLFDHAYDANPPSLSPAEAARAILTAHAYALSGSGGKFMQSPMVAGYAVMFEGKNLFETLVLNLFGYRDDYLTDLRLRKTGDAPWWEWESDPPLSKNGQTPKGLTDLLTWRSRSLRLLPEPDGRVSRVQYAQGYAIRDPDLLLVDPYKRYVMSDSGSNKGKWTPRYVIPGRALWRDVDALIERAGTGVGGPEKNRIPKIVAWVSDSASMLDAGADSIQPSIVVTGLVVKNFANVELWRMDRLPIPMRLLQDMFRQKCIAEAIQDAEQMRSVLRDAGKAHAIARLTRGMRSPDGDDIKREQAALRLDERYWSSLEREFQAFLVNLAQADHPSQPLTQWRQMLEQHVRQVYEQATLANPTQYRAWVAGNSELSKRLARISWTETARQSDERRKRAAAALIQEAAHAIDS